MTSLNQSQKESTLLETGNPTVSIREWVGCEGARFPIHSSKPVPCCQQASAHLLGKLCGQLVLSVGKDGICVCEKPRRALADNPAISGEVFWMWQKAGTRAKADTTSFNCRS